MEDNSEALVPFKPVEVAERIAKKRGVGRPTVLNVEVMQAFASYLRAGNYVTVACASLGVHVDTYYGWMRRGRSLMQKLESDPTMHLTDDEELLVAFTDEMIRAQAQAEAKDLQVIDEAGEKGQWQAKAWKLERTRPGRYSKRTHVDVDANFTIDEKRAKLRGLLAPQDPKLEEALLLVAEATAAMPGDSGDEDTVEAEIDGDDEEG